MKIYVSLSKNRKIYYHGTLMKNVRTILKSGLISNEDNRRSVHYDGYTDADFRSRTMKTITGVYLTKSPEKALEFGAQLARTKHKDKTIVWDRMSMDGSSTEGSIIVDDDPPNPDLRQAIVICQVEQNTDMPDEDSLVNGTSFDLRGFMEGVFGNELGEKQLLSFKNKAIQHYLLASAELSGNISDKVTKEMNGWITRVVGSIAQYFVIAKKGAAYDKQVNRQKEILNISSINREYLKVVKAFVIKSFIRSAAHLSLTGDIEVLLTKNLKKFNRSYKTNLTMDDLIPITSTSVEEIENSHRKSIVDLMKAFKGLRDKDIVESVTVPSVGFTGSNKILAILEVICKVEDKGEKSEVNIDFKLVYSDRSPEAKAEGDKTTKNYFESIAKDLLHYGVNSFNKEEYLFLRSSLTNSYIARKDWTSIVYKNLESTKDSSYPAKFLKEIGRLRFNGRGLILTNKNDLISKFKEDLAARLLEQEKEKEEEERRFESIKSIVGPITDTAARMWDTFIEVNKASIYKLLEGETDIFDLIHPVSMLFYRSVDVLFGKKKLRNKDLDYSMFISDPETKHLLTSLTKEQTNILHESTVKKLDFKVDETVDKFAKELSLT
jgi:hypothetical protein